MPSPFPGMNPYLEQSYDWEEFHLNFIARMQQVLHSRVGPKYIVKAEMRLILHERSAAERGFIGRTNVGISREKESGPTSASDVLDAPMRLRLPAFEEEKQRYLEIRDAKNRRIVTIIELLSPSNKKLGRSRRLSCQEKSSPAFGGQFCRNRPAEAVFDRLRPFFRRAITTSWIADTKTSPPSVFGHSVCTIRCRPFRCRFRNPIRRSC